MLLIPYEAETDEEKEKLKRVGAVEASPVDLKDIFARSYLKSQGFFGDNDIDQITAQTQQLPLLTYPFIDFLLTTDLTSRRLVELGSGNSTILFSKLFQSVRSYETDPRWLEQTRSKVGTNTMVLEITREALEAADFEIDNLDILLIDFAGKRTKFIKSYLDKAKKKAPVIFFDNTDMYRTGVSLLREAGYIEIPFYGFKSGQTWISCTSMFISDIGQAPACTKYISTDFTKNRGSNSWDAF